MMGGNPTIQTLISWSKTVASNPVIVHFTVAPLSTLLTTYYFPNDRNIDEKRKLFETVVSRYMRVPLSCASQCSVYGTCIPTGYFRLGKCQCDGGWFGPDCSISEPFPNGFWVVSSKSGNRCPRSFQNKSLYIAAYPGRQPNGYYTRPIKLEVCSSTEQQYGVGPEGTLCGLKYFDFKVPCHGRIPSIQECPKGYSIYLRSESGTTEPNLWSCKKESDYIHDAPGTLCGFSSTVFNPDLKAMDCGLFNIANTAHCPPGYKFNARRIPHRWSGAAMGFCSKVY